MQFTIRAVVQFCTYPTKYICHCYFASFLRSTKCSSRASNKNKRPWKKNERKNNEKAEMEPKTIFTRSHLIIQTDEKRKKEQQQRERKRQKKIITISSIHLCSVGCCLRMWVFCRFFSRMLSSCSPTHTFPPNSFGIFFFFFYSLVLSLSSFQMDKSISLLNTGCALNG